MMNYQLPTTNYQLPTTNYQLLTTTRLQYCCDQPRLASLNTMVKFLTQHAKWIIVAVGLLAFGLTQTPWVTNSDLWQKWQGALIDRRYSNRAGKPAHPDIKLVGLANSTISMDELAPEEI